MSLMSCCLGIYSCTCCTLSLPHSHTCFGVCIIMCLISFIRSVHGRAFCLHFHNIYVCVWMWQRCDKSKPTYTICSPYLRLCGWNQEYTQAKIRFSGEEKNAHSIRHCRLLLHLAKFNHYTWIGFVALYIRRVSSLSSWLFIRFADSEANAWTWREKKYDVMIMMMLFEMLGTLIFNRRLPANKFTHYAQPYTRWKITHFRVWMHRVEFEWHGNGAGTWGKHWGEMVNKL